MDEHKPETRKVCPLRYISPTLGGDLDLCNGPDCGWWDNEDGCCSVVSIKDSLRVISEAPKLHEEE